MTVVAVLCDPPRPGLVGRRLIDTSPLSAEQVAELYAAMLGDVVRAVADSGGEVLVNYRPDDALAPAHRPTDGPDAETAVRSAVGDVDARYEVQVGETAAARVGNTVTHLLEREDAATAAVVEPTAALLSRQRIDSAAMKLRRHGMVLGPAPGGRVYYAGFRDPIDFTDAFATPAIETLTRRGCDAGISVDFLPMDPVIETGTDLAGALALLRARQAADHATPSATTDWCATAGVRPVPTADGAMLELAVDDRPRDA